MAVCSGGRPGHAAGLGDRQRLIPPRDVDLAGRVSLQRREGRCTGAHPVTGHRLADRGVRANAICPGYIDTPINEAYFATFGDPAAARRKAEALHPLGRIGTAAEVASAIHFLASDESGFTTGTTLTLDGGRSALMQDPE